jgi:hypothetical protein
LESQKACSNQIGDDNDEDYLMGKSNESLVLPTELVTNASLALSSISVLVVKTLKQVFFFFFFWVYIYYSPLCFYFQLSFSQRIQLHIF